MSRIVLIDDDGAPVAVIAPSPDGDEGRALAHEIIDAACNHHDMTLIPAAIRQHLATAPEGTALATAMAALHYLAETLTQLTQEIRKEP